MQNLQSNNEVNNEVIRSITFAGDNSQYTGTLYLHPSINKIIFEKEESVISNISIPDAFPSNSCKCCVNNYKDLQRNINIYLPNNGRFGDLNVLCNSKVTINSLYYNKNNLYFLNIKHFKNNFSFADNISLIQLKYRTYNLRDITIKTTQNVITMKEHYYKALINRDEKTIQTIIKDKNKIERNLIKTQKKLTNTKKDLNNTYKKWQNTKTELQRTNNELTNTNNTLNNKILALAQAESERGDALAAKTQAESEIDILKVAKAQEGTQLKEIVSNISNKMKPGTISIIKDIYDLIKDKIDIETLLNISKTNSRTILRIDDICNLVKDKITTEILLNISKMDSRTMFKLNSICVNISDKITTELLLKLSTATNGEELQKILDENF